MHNPMTNIRPGRDLNPVSLSYEPQPDRMSYWGKPEFKVTVGEAGVMLHIVFIRHRKADKFDNIDLKLDIQLLIAIHLSYSPFQCFNSVYVTVNMSVTVSIGTFI